MLKTNKIEVLENGTIQVRQLEVLELADGTIRSGGYQRFCLTPDTDINTIESPDIHVTQGFNHDWLSFLSVESFTNKIELNVFPNPTTQYVNIVATKKTNLVVYDLVGNIVLSQTVSKNEQIDLSHLSAGIYPFQFNKNNSKVKTIKVIIQ